MNGDFYKVYGFEEAHNGLLELSAKHFVLFYGFGTDDLGGWNWRKDYDHVPDKSELRADVERIINGNTDARILSGMVWQGKQVWLSTENQFNFKCAYDIAVQTGGASLPATYKLGEDGQGLPIYHTFETLDDFTDFYMSCVGWIQQCISDGWAEKDGVDYDAMLDGMND